MIEDSSLKNEILQIVKNIAPANLMQTLRPFYHWAISAFSAFYYGYPSRKMRVISVTGTKGKSTTTFMLAYVLRGLGEKVASIGSLGYSINDKSWPNNLKMTMPGRGKIHKFMKQAVDAGCRWCVLETTSEGIEQSRLVGVYVDTAVFTNLHPEHIESHGSMENYKNAKLKLFAQTPGTHVLNYEDPYFADFSIFNPKQTVTYGLQKGMLTLADCPDLNLKIKGDFNLQNALAFIATCVAHGFDKNEVIRILNSIEEISGRMQSVDLKSGAVAIIDYAHTPDSLRLVYENARKMIAPQGKLIVVLGACGGGRDKWKRPIFGKIAQQYADKIVLTNEDPFDEEPTEIISQIQAGFVGNFEINPEIILDRKLAIEYACEIARDGDVIVITGKGSENSMALAGGVKIPWSDATIVKSYK